MQGIGGKKTLSVIIKFLYIFVVSFCFVICCFKYIKYQKRCVRFVTVANKLCYWRDSITSTPLKKSFHVYDPILLLTRNAHTTCRVFNRSKWHQIELDFFLLLNVCMLPVGQALQCQISLSLLLKLFSVVSLQRTIK